MGRIALVLAPLVLVAGLFVALALAGDGPGGCPSFKHHRRLVTGIQAHGLGSGFGCQEIRAALDRWVDRRFPHRAAGWRFTYRQDCSCHVADRRLPDGRAQRFVFN
jgi:hypothetical protein